MTPMSWVGAGRQAGSVSRSLMCGLVAVVAWVAPAQAQFVPNETLVSPNPILLDPEFSQMRAKFAWADVHGNLWLGGVNRATGAFEPVSGQGELITDNVINSGVRLIFNGPEWLSTASGDQIFYSYYADLTKPRTLSNTRIAVAVQSRGGGWVVKRLDPFTPHHMGISSQTPGDPNAQIMYWDPQLNYYWRNYQDASSEKPLPFLKPAAKAWRFVTGQRAIIYTAPVDGVVQVFTYQLDTGEHTQMTFDAGDKDTGRQVPWMWRAPEFNNEYVFSTFVNERELRIYRKIPGPDGKRRWTPVFSFTQPNGIINSVQYFIYNNKSYLYWGVYETPNDWPTEVWVSNIDPADPLTRRITDNSKYRARSDPEHFITTDHGPVIYYNRYDPARDPTGDHPMCPECSEGIFRADAGLLGR